MKYNHKLHILITGITVMKDDLAVWKCMLTISINISRDFIGFLEEVK